MNNEETVKSFLDTWVEVLGPRPTLNNALCITLPGQNRQAKGKRCTLCIYIKAQSLGLWSFAFLCTIPLEGKYLSFPNKNAQDGKNDDDDDDGDEIQVDGGISVALSEHLKSWSARSGQFFATSTSTPAELTTCSVQWKKAPQQ